MVQEHIVSVYDDELTNLDRLVVKMGKEVSDLMTHSIKSLINQDIELADKVIAKDKEIDAIEMEIDGQATRILALRQPMAADLRAVIASLKMSNDLERMGDYAKNISRRAKTLSNASILPSSGKALVRMTKAAGAMIDLVIEAYVEKDVQKALDVIAADDDVDMLYTSMFREILTYMMEDPRNISACTHLLFIAKNIERVGDHATNIAEQVYYIVEGKQYEEGHTNLDNTPFIMED